MPLLGRQIVRRRMNVIRRNVREAISVEMNDIGDEILSRSRDLAPQLTGAMQSSSLVLSRDDQTTFVRIIAWQLPRGATRPYQVYQHQGIGGTETTIGRAFIPGPVTAGKRNAGLQYLQRAADEAAEGRGASGRFTVSIPRRLGRTIQRAIRLSLR